MSHAYTPHSYSNLIGPISQDQRDACVECDPQILAYPWSTEVMICLLFAYLPDSLSIYFIDQGIKYRVSQKTWIFF